ncbi:MAG: hypothetical protein HY717_09200 [Planctomycetes bacterium]|nr:hypothetical protein [Planctomycetota bacterium]
MRKLHLTKAVAFLGRYPFKFIANIRIPKLKFIATAFGGSDFRRNFFLFSWFLTGCGLYVNGRTQAVFIYTDPPGVDAIYEPDPLGDPTIYKTPILINLTRHGGEFGLYKKGYAPEKLKFVPHADGLLIFGDIILGFPIYLIADGIYGAWNTLKPDSYNIILKPVSAEEAERIEKQRAEAAQQKAEERRRREEEKRLKEEKALRKGFRQ